MSYAESCYKKGKKGIAKLLVLMMAVSAFSAFAPVSASADEVSFNCTLNEDFEDENYNYDVGAGTTAQDYVSVVDTGDLFYGKALKLDLSKADVTKSYTYDINAKSRYVPSTYTESENYYSEVSFDIAPTVNGRPVWIYFRNSDDSKNNIFGLQFSESKNQIYLYYKGNTAKQVGTFTNGKWINVKLVQQWTDSEKNKVHQVTKVYIDGALAAESTAEAKFSFYTDSPGKFNTIRLSCVGKNSAVLSSAVIDNLSCVNYTSADGTSPVADFSKLKAEIVSSSALLSSDKYSEGDKAQFKQDILKAISVSNNITSTQTQVNDALAALLSAKADLRALSGETKLLYEDFEDETYNILNNTLTNGTIDSTTYADKFYNKVLKYTYDTDSKNGFAFVNLKSSGDTNRGSYNASTVGDYVETSVDFRPFGTKEYGKNMYLRFGNEGNPDNYAIVFALTMNGELNVQTFFASKATTYFGGDAKNMTTGSLTIARDIDLNRMHNLKLVLYKNPVQNFTTASEPNNPEIAGIYLDGEKLDFVDNSEQTIYPMHSPVTRIPYLRAYTSSTSSNDELGKYGVLLDNITMTKINGTRVVDRALLKSAITEAYYVFDTLSEDQKSKVTAKLSEAEALYKAENVGQSECDNMAKELNMLLLPSLSTYIDRISIPETISTNEIVLPSFDDGVTTTTITSDRSDVITSDGKVIQPIDKAVDVNISINLSRESGETASKVYTVTVLPRLAVEISSVEYKDADNNIVYGPVNNGSLSQITVSKNSDIAAKIIAAVYNSSELENAKVIDAAEGTQTLNIALGENGAKKDVRFFVWSDLTSISPVQAVVKESEKTSVYILSDSIYAVEPVSAILDGQGCLGKVLQDNYNSEKVEIKNHAYCGSSTRTFADSYKLNTALNTMKPGDYAIISFAHNDEKSYLTANYAPLDTKTTAPFTYGTYQAYLERYVKEVREQGATPILITSVPRFVFGDDGKLSESHGGYIQAMKDVAAATNCLLIDLNGYAMEQINNLGEENAAKYYNLPDKTHLSEEGAKFFADYISKCISDFNLSISKYEVK